MERSRVIKIEWGFPNFFGSDIQLLNKCKLHKFERDAVFTSEIEQISLLNFTFNYKI